MAYEMIKRLQHLGEIDLLCQLSIAVEAKRKANKILHEVWELSFDWKECNSHAFINQKLDYMPVRTAVAGRARQSVYGQMESFRSNVSGTGRCVTGTTNVLGKRTTA